MGIKKKIVTRLAWPLVSTGTAWLAGAAAERVMERGMKKARGRRRGPLRLGKRASLGSQLAWTAASAAIAGVCGVLAERGSETAWKKATGKRPPRQ